MSELFHKIEGEAAILHSKGVFFQVDIFECKRFIYARKGAGYVRLIAVGRTSHPGTHWSHISVPTVVGEYGYLIRGEPQ